MIVICNIILMYWDTVSYRDYTMLRHRYSVSGVSHITTNDQLLFLALSLFTLQPFCTSQQVPVGSDPQLVWPVWPPVLWVPYTLALWLELIHLSIPFWTETWPIWDHPPPHMCSKSHQHSIMIIEVWMRVCVYGSMLEYIIHNHWDTVNAHTDRQTDRQTHTHTLVVVHVHTAAWGNDTSFHQNWRVLLDHPWAAVVSVVHYYYTTQHIHIYM